MEGGKKKRVPRKKDPGASERGEGGKFREVAERSQRKQG